MATRRPTKSSRGAFEASARGAGACTPLALTGTVLSNERKKYGRPKAAEYAKAVAIEGGIHAGRGRGCVETAATTAAVVAVVMAVTAVPFSGGGGRSVCRTSAARSATRLLARAEAHGEGRGTEGRSGGVVHTTGHRLQCAGRRITRINHNYKLSRTVYRHV